LRSTDLWLQDNPEYVPVPVPDSEKDSAASLDEGRKHEILHRLAASVSVACESACATPVLLVDTHRRAVPLIRGERLMTTNNSIRLMENQMTEPTNPAEFFDPPRWYERLFNAAHALAMIRLEMPDGPPPTQKQALLATHWLVKAALSPEIAQEIAKLGAATQDDDMPVEQWLAIRKEAGLQIDPATAEVEWTYEQTLDPYGINPDLPEECRQVGREYFARAPGSDVWVWFGDLPEATRSALWEKHKSRLAFPAGLF
jgi:hypothetical protein